MAKKSIRHIPLSCLGPRALEQLAAQGVKVPLMSPAAQTPTASQRAHKFGVSAPEARTDQSGEVYDSKFELACANRLRLLGILFDTQVVLNLQPACEHRGKKIRPIDYHADFRIGQGEQALYIDSKGFRTESFKIKWKMLLFRYPNIDAVQVKNLAELTLVLQQRGLLPRLITT